MKAHLRSIRIAPKKANLVAGMVRGLPVSEALSSLERTNKKAARILEDLLKSAIANAKQNDNQDAADLVVKTIVVNKAQAYHRGVPMARGRVRSMRKFLSHITITLGVQQETPGNEKVKKPASDSASAKATADKKATAGNEKKTETPSQKAKKPVKTTVKSEKDKSSKEETVTAPASASKSSTPKK